VLVWGNLDEPESSEQKHTFDSEQFLTDLGRLPIVRSKRIEQGAVVASHRLQHVRGVHQCGYKVSRLLALRFLLLSYRAQLHCPQGLTSVASLPTNGGGEEVAIAKPKSHWSVRAEDYETLAKRCENPEVSHVFDHLARVCQEMGRAPKAKSLKRTEMSVSWLDRATAKLEATSGRWRSRATEYRAMASSATTAVGTEAWLTVAGRCDEIASYLEATTQAVSSATTRAEPAKLQGRRPVTAYD
jgi:hypothetical protein